MSKGSKRRPGDLAAYRANYDRIYDSHSEALECPNCGEIELRPAAHPMWVCSHCKQELQF